jgi:hypothetical protein
MRVIYVAFAWLGILLSNLVGFPDNSVGPGAIPAVSMGVEVRSPFPSLGRRGLSGMSWYAHGLIAAECEKLSLLRWFDWKGA